MSDTHAVSAKGEEEAADVEGEVEEAIAVHCGACVRSGVNVVECEACVCSVVSVVVCGVWSGVVEWRVE